MNPRGENRVAYGSAEDAGEGAVEAALHDVPLQHLPLVELGDLRHAAIGAPAGAQAATVCVRPGGSLDLATRQAKPAQRLAIQA